MLKNNQARPTIAVLLAGLLVWGLLTQSVRAAAPDSQAQAKATQEANSTKQVASTAQPKVSPYAKMNRQRAQANAADATKAPDSSPEASAPGATKAPHSSSHAARKGKSGAKKS